MVAADISPQLTRKSDTEGPELCSPVPSTCQDTEATEALAWVLFRHMIGMAGLSIQGRTDPGHTRLGESSSGLNVPDQT